MTLPAVAEATTAAPLAALLPARRGKAWKVGPAPYGIRNNAATSRITDGRRALILVEEGNRVELYADRPNLFPITPDAVADSTDPASVAALAARALRWALPDLDADATRAAAHDTASDGMQQWQRIMHHKGTELTEFGFHLIDHGANPQASERCDGPGLEWTAESGAEWAVWAYGCAGNFHLTYDGPVSGLYGALPVLLPPLGGHTPTDAGSAFTRHLTDRFPQLRPVDADEVEFGGYRDLHGWIALPSRAELGDPVDGDTRVCAQVGAVGIDFLLSASAHLV
ncbi:hypothetical protein ABZT04_33310 [Streptomyces sp. NPDC005492]|uniref:hypothetical protein n=1 Tax=Streptomyces sp. NPDC005492 TaxID=3156883 RepID=UPI0033AF75AB